MDGAAGGEGEGELNRFDQALRPRGVQPAQNRFVLEGDYLYPEEKAEFSKTSFVLAMQRLLASARARSPQMVALSVLQSLSPCKKQWKIMRQLGTFLVAKISFF